jgi:hypothetical protein
MRKKIEYPVFHLHLSYFITVQSYKKKLMLILQKLLIFEIRPSFNIL